MKKTYSFTRFVISLQDASRMMGERKHVSTTRNRLIPSTPT